MTLILKTAKLDPAARVDLKQLQVFSKIFPRVKDLRVWLHSQFPEVMTESWTAWPGLESLFYEIFMELPLSNHDSCNG
jgi:hypothetical protein